MNLHDKLHAQLKNQGYSVTTPRTVVFDTLAQAHEAVTIAQVIAATPAIDKVSVYRTLQLFEKTGIVHRVWNGFKSKFELSEDFSPHHHHFTCLHCNTAVTIKNEGLESSLRALEKVYGFELLHHSVELSGRCKKCLAAALNQRELKTTLSQTKDTIDP